MLSFIQFGLFCSVQYTNYLTIWSRLLFLNIMIHRSHVCSIKKKKLLTITTLLHFQGVAVALPIYFATKRYYLMQRLVVNEIYISQQPSEMNLALNISNLQAKSFSKINPKISSVQICHECEICMLSKLRT